MNATRLNELRRLTKSWVAGEVLAECLDEILRLNAELLVTRQDLDKAILAESPDGPKPPPRCPTCGSSMLILDGADCLWFWKCSACGKRSGAYTTFDAALDAWQPASHAPVTDSATQGWQEGGAR